jgi:hypothetical protein
MDAQISLYRIERLCLTLDPSTISAAFAVPHEANFSLNQYTASSLTRLSKQLTFPSRR